MTRPSHTREAYEEAAREKGLIFLGQTTPDSVHTQTTWKCPKCGSILTKNYRAVKYGKNGCSCNNGVTLDADSYHYLAQLLGIKWLGPVNGSEVPRNTKEKTRWQGISPQGLEMPIVEATYHQLAYTPMTKRLAAKLGLPEPQPAGIVGQLVAQAQSSTSS